MSLGPGTLDGTSDSAGQTSTLVKLGPHARNVEGETLCRGRDLGPGALHSSLGGVREVKEGAHLGSNRRKDAGGDERVWCVKARRSARANVEEETEERLGRLGITRSQLPKRTRG